MASATFPNTVDRTFSVSSGDNPRHTSSKSSISTNKMEAWTRTTPIVASKPEVIKRCTIAGGTYFPQDLTAVRILLNARWRLVISSATFSPVSTVSRASASMSTRSKLHIACMSSTNARRGISSVLENLETTLLNSRMKISISTKMVEVVITENMARCRNSSSVSKRTALLAVSSHFPSSGQHINKTSEARFVDRAMISSTRLNGSSSDLEIP
mmetsp:Transcript_24671/g.46826  ORF Transcript_24671/g.46826 Transcript_24671/m.46826 type:complete len:213 (-) Transcript_24671:133-771(-)